MIKQFNEWNEEKKKVDKNELGYGVFYNPGDVWWCAVGLNVGVEIDGKHENFERPILVVRKFNKDMFWGLPLTTKGQQSEFYVKVLHEDGISWAILSQLKTFSTKRLSRKIGTISEDQFRYVRKRLRRLL